MDDFERAVYDGLALTKRLYVGRNDQPVTMESDHAGKRHFPKAPTVYAVISDPSIVDNPDMPSYQPQVYGRRDPPALIPMQMKGAELDVNCIVSSAMVEFRGSFRVHCVASNRKCDCRIVVPVREKSSFLGVEIDVCDKSYSTDLTLVEEAKSYMERIPRNEDMMFMRHQIFSLTIPQVEGGSVVSVRIRWFQHVSYFEGWFSVSIPFTFKEYAIPLGKLLKKEKIHVTVESGSGKELTYKSVSHPLKETTRHMGKLYLSYEAEVIRWSSYDFCFSYAVSSADIFGGLLVQSAAEDDFDKRDIFSLFVFPGSNPHKLVYNVFVFMKEVIFVIDMSESMDGGPLEESKRALSEALLKLRSTDSFNIISFNNDIYLFSSFLEPATEKNVEAANQWLNEKCQPTGGTNMLLPLSEAMKMFSKSPSCISHILFITDGSVKDENIVFDVIKNEICDTGPNSPRISTFGIGLYCNHYFLRLLALIGRGHYDSAYVTDAIFSHMERFFYAALNPLLTNISIHDVNYLDGMEEYMIPFPDLSLGCPLVVSGRCRESFLGTQNVTGSLANGRKITIDLNAQQTKGLILDQVVTKQQIDMLTAQAWASGSNQLIEQIARISIQHSIPCEFTQMVVLPTSEKRTSPGPQKSKVGKNSQVFGLHLGFGNTIATENNTRIVSAETNGAKGCDTDQSSSCCCNLGVFGDCCCCCSCCGDQDVGSTNKRATDDLASASTQCCASLACFGCMECCS